MADRRIKKRLADFLRGASSDLTTADLSEKDRSALADHLDPPAAKSRRKAPPPAGKPGVAQVFCDGASRGNPGLAALGVAIYVDGVETYSFGRCLGEMSNNQAEYRSLLAALDAAAELGLKKIEVLMDSELVVKQVRGEYKVKNEGLKPLHAEVKLKTSAFGVFEIRHIPRAENSVADALANEALDSL